MNALAKVDAFAVIKAVVIAFLFGLVIGAAIGFVGFRLTFAEVLTEDTIKNSILLHAVIFCLGLLPNILAGYLAASFAQRDEFVHAGLAGTAMLVIAGLSYLLPDEDPFTVLDGVALVETIPLALAGAAIWKHGT